MCIRDSYENPEDSEACELQSYIQINGIENAVAKYSGLEAGIELHRIICENYRMIKGGIPRNIIIEKAEDYVFQRHKGC